MTIMEMNNSSRIKRETGEKRWIDARNLTMGPKTSLWLFSGLFRRGMCILPSKEHVVLQRESNNNGNNGFSDTCGDLRGRGGSSTSDFCAEMGFKT